MARRVLHTEASTGFGGQELRILDEADWLRRHGWEVLVAGQPGSRLLAEAQARALPAVAVRMRSPVDLPAVVALRRVMRRARVALVHTHSSVDSWVATLAAKSLGLPVVRSRHVSIPVRRRRALVYRLADRILASGETIRAHLIEVGIPASRIVAVPAGVDVARFHPGVDGARVRRELGLAGPVVGLVANLRGSKGHAVFLRAAARVLARRPETRFLIVGDGVAAPRVRADIAAAGLERAVIMTGFRRDVPEVMAALDVLVLPSTRTDATPQVIPQALAVGTPVVATTVGGIPELVHDGETGRLVPPGDDAALADAILALLDDPGGARAMARAGQARVLRELTFDAMMAKTTAVYRELLGA